MNISEEVYLEHFGIKGMKWGVRNSSKAVTPTERRAQIEKKIDKMSGQRIYQGAGLTGFYAQKGKAPKTWDAATNRATRRLALRGAVEAGVILGGSFTLLKHAKLSKSGRDGLKLSAALLAAKAGQIRLSQIHDVRVSGKHRKLINERNAIDKAGKR